jgi:predicted GIY-YIG superfamily endonuclease
MKRFVYVLQSVRTPDRYYTGLTSDVPARLAAHNARLPSRRQPFHIGT